MICGVSFPHSIIKSLFTYQYAKEPTVYVLRVATSNFQHDLDGKRVEIWRADRRRIVLENVRSILPLDTSGDISVNHETLVFPGNGIQFLLDQLEK